MRCAVYVQARFGWQISDERSALTTGPKYHRMAMYTNEPDAPTRRATPVERLRCTKLSEHGLRPGGGSAPFPLHAQMAGGGRRIGGVASAAGAPAPDAQQTRASAPAADEDLTPGLTAEEEASELSIALRFALRLRDPGAAPHGAQTQAEAQAPVGSCG